MFRPLLKSPSPQTNQVWGRISTITTQLRASQATAFQLRSENQRIQAEIYKIIHEITDTPTPGKNPPGPEWFSILSSGVEAQMLRSNYDELRNNHLTDSCEITEEIYAKMVRRHNNLRKFYEQALNSHAALQEGLQRLAQQLPNTLGVRISWSLLLQ